MQRIARAFRAGLLVCLVTVQVVAAEPPLTNSPQQLLSRFRTASGGAGWDAVSHLVAEGEVASGGMRGPISGGESLHDGRSYTRFELGTFRSSEGRDAKGAWRTGPGGEVTRIDDPGDLAGAVNQSWLARRAYWYPERLDATLRTAPTRKEGDSMLDCLEATPTGGRALVLCFARDTGLLVLVDEFDGRDHTQTRYLDYRPVGGLILPFRLVVGRGDPKYDATITWLSWKPVDTLPDSAFEPPAAAIDFRFANDTGRTELPFRLRNNHIYVDAQVDGKPVRLMVDTGGMNVLTPEAVARLGLSSEGSIEGRGGGEKSQDVSLARARLLQLGEVSVDAPVFFVFDFQEIARIEGEALDGLVGFEVFHRFLVRIDYERSVLTLSDPTRHALPPGAKPIAFTLNEQTPAVAGSIDGLVGRFTIDTGSRTSLTLHSPFVREHGLVQRYAASEPAVTGWGVGGSVRTRPARGERFCLAETCLEAPVLELFEGTKGAFSAPGIAGNVGGELLRRYTLTLDYRNLRLTLEPNADATLVPAFDRSGLWLRRDEGGVRVDDVAAGSAAERAGLKAGDEIVRIDGRVASDLVLSDTRRLWRESPVGTRVVLVVRTAEGTTTERTLVLADRIPAPRGSAMPQPD